jgi:DNA-binding transcriptional LysR family regulator
VRRRIPSLEALVAFEAAARHQSFTRAAVALSLTQSAVCKQIAALEDYLGLALFHRVKKRISLTEAGELYARQIGEDLDRLERHTGALMTHRGEGNVLELASVPTFATRWLIPRLGAFKARHPGITLNLTTRSQPFIFTDTGFDAAIHFGSPEWPGASTSALFGEEMIPVCSPQLLPPAGCASAADLARLPLLHHSGRHDAWPRWFEHAGVRDVEVSAGARFELFSMLIEAALARLGVALVPRFLAQRELAAGELVVPFQRSLESAQAYYLVIPETPGPSAALLRFAAWLQDEAAAYRQGASSPGAARALPDGAAARDGHA